MVAHSKPDLTMLAECGRLVLLVNRLALTKSLENKGIMALNATNKRISAKDVEPAIWGLAVYDNGTKPKSGDTVIVTNRWGATSQQVLGDQVILGKTAVVVPADMSKGLMGYSLWLKAEL